jgi:chorismate mutase
MDSESLKAELEAAYKSLDKADRQIQRLLVERKQNELVLGLLETAGFIAEGKLDEAKNIVDGFYRPTPPTEEHRR